jgi:putative effector of murein hydrolase
VLENATPGSTVTAPKSVSISEKLMGWTAKVYAIALIWTGVYWIVTRDTFDTFINIEITSWIKFGVILSQ